MSAKKDPVLIDAGECPKKWNKILKDTGTPQEKSTRKEVQQDSIRVIDPRSKNPKPMSLDEAGAHWGSATQDTNNGIGLPESTPPPKWVRSQAFMRAMAWIFACKNRLPKQQRDELLKDVDDLHSSNPLPEFDPACWGRTAVEFLDRWRGHEVDVRFVYSAKHQAPMFELWSESLPPDEPDDWDEDDGGAPRGHWDGLKWTADPPESAG